MTRTIPALLLALTLGLGTATAQEGGKEAKVRRFLEVSGRSGVGAAILELTMAQVAHQPGVPEGFVDALRKSADVEAFQNRLALIYGDLDEDVLDAAIAFYETEPGKRLARAQGNLDASLQNTAGEWIQEAAMQAMQAQGMPTPRESMEGARRLANEAAAIGALKTLNTAQALFREADKDNNDQFDYAGSMAALGATRLIDEVLASGEKGGYRFELCTGSEAPEFLWMAVASPIEPGKTGERHFVTNQAGVIFYSREAPFELDRATCQIPEGATPVGR